MANPIVKGTCYDTGSPAHVLTVTFTVTVKAVTANSNGSEISIASLNFTSSGGTYNVPSTAYTDTPNNNQFFVEYNRLTTPGTVDREGPKTWSVSPCVINPHLA